MPVRAFCYAMYNLPTDDFLNFYCLFIQIRRDCSPHEKEDRGCLVDSVDGFPRLIARQM